MDGLAGKIADSASMLWQTLDERERTLVLLAVCWAVSGVYLTIAESRRRRDEDRLLARLRAEMQVS